MERLANPTKTNTVQRPRGKEKSSATDLVHRWRNPETYYRIDGATPKSKGDEPSRPWGVSKSERPAPSIRALWKRAEPSFLNLVYYCYYRRWKMTIDIYIYIFIYLFILIYTRIYWYMIIQKYDISIAIDFKFTCQGLVNVLFWGFWTSLEKVSVGDNLPNIWVMWKIRTFSNPWW